MEKINYAADKISAFHPVPPFAAITIFYKVT